MPEQKQQNYANHAKFDPPFHFFLAPILLANFIVNIVSVVRNPNFHTIWGMVFAFAVLALLFKMRIYALKVQDRLIRLEERLRLGQLLPEPLRTSAGQLTEGQLVALRFASDAELPGLVEKTLAGNLKSAEIKKSIVNWRPDYFRV